MIRETDGQGNSLLIESKKARGTQQIDLYIKLASERYRRHVGRVIENVRRFHVERSENIHLLKKANAYGFNYHVLKVATKFDTVVIHEKESKSIYSIPREDILAKGKFMFFKQQGFELQTFIDRETLNVYKVLDLDLICKLQHEYRLSI